MPERILAGRLDSANGPQYKKLGHRTGAAWLANSGPAQTCGSFPAHLRGRSAAIFAGFRVVICFRSNIGPRRRGVRQMTQALPHA